MHPDLYPYQVYGAKWLASQKNAILGDQMGVGKTSAAIAGADACGARQILVVVPGVARVNWEREFAHWQTVPRSVGAIHTSKILPGTEVVVVSYSLIGSQRVLRYLMSRNWDLLIVDEAQCAKSDVALRTRCLYGTKCDASFGLASKARRVWLLSGTLMPNNASELWTHCRALFPDVAQGRSYRQWRDYYCTLAPGTDKVVGTKNGEELVGLLRPHVLRRRLMDVHKDMPPLRFSQVVVEPDKLPPKSTEIEQTEIIVRGAIAKMGKGDTDAARAALQAVDEIHLASLRKWTGIAKAPAIADYVKGEMEAGLEKVIIFAMHTEVILALTAALPGAYAIRGATPVKERQRLIDGFQGRIPGFAPRALICHVEIASTALTLTAACDVIFAEQPWTPATIQQAAARCHRLGQTRPVLARIFSLKGSIDEQIGATLTRKARETAKFNDGVTLAA